MSRMTILTLIVVSVASSFTRVGIAADKAHDSPRVNEQRVAELTELIEAKPDEPVGYRLRAIEYARGQAWGKAAADFVKLAKLTSGSSQIGQRIAVLLVLAEDKKTHAVLCEELQKEYSESGTAGDLERTAKVAALMPELVGKPETLLDMARQSVETNRSREFAAHHHRTLGLVLYRLKKYGEAIAAIRRADEANSVAVRKIDNVTICNRAIEAMCLVRTGEMDEAKKILAKATPLLDEKFKHPTLLYQNQWWHDWLIAKVLHDQALELLTKGVK